MQAMKEMWPSISKMHEKQKYYFLRQLALVMSRSLYRFCLGVSLAVISANKSLLSRDTTGLLWFRFDQVFLNTVQV